MTTREKSLLIKQGTKLVTLGVQVEEASARLRQLVEKGVSYTDPQMLKAYERFVELDANWKRLEQEHLENKKRLASK